MVTKKLCSPFLFGLLAVVLLLIACTETPKIRKKQKETEAINSQLKAAENIQFTTIRRLDSATKAFDGAVKLDSAFLVWRAFTTKYPLLQAEFPNATNVFLERYATLASQKKDSLNLANALFIKGKRAAENGIPDSAYFYYNASRIICEARKDSLAVVEKIINLAYLHYNLSDYAEFENTTTEALKFLPAIPKTNLDSVYLSFAYNNYGLAFTNMYEPQSALNYYQKASNLNMDAAFRNSIKNNEALVYMSEQQYEKVFPLLSGLVTSGSLRADTVLYTQVLDNLGYSLFKMNDSTAIDYLIKAYDLREKAGNSFGTVASLIHLAEYYKNKDPKLFTTYATMAYQKATAQKSANDRLDALRLLSDEKVPENQKFIRQYIQIKDSLDQARQKSRNQFAKIKYDSKTSKEENLKLQAQQAKYNLQLEQQKNAGLFIILAALIITGIAVYVYIRSKAQKRKAIHETETRIAKQLHDELANDMHHTMMVADTLDTTIPQQKENFLQNLENLYQRTRKISKENQDIDTGEKYPKILKEKIADYQSAAVNVISSGIEDIPWDKISRDKKIAVHRIIQEWLVNMKKHSQCNIAVIKFVKDGKKAVISYQDNGIGVAKNAMILKGGLQNVEIRIQTIKGTVIFGKNSATGFHAEITFPI